MLPIQGLDHVVIRSAHSEQLIRFYRDVLGCSVEREGSPELGLTQLRAGNSLIDIVSTEGEIGRQGGAAPGSDGHNMDHFCLLLAPFDAEAILAHLASHRVKTSGVEQRYGATGMGPSIYLRDPDGNRVELKGAVE